MVTDSPDSKQRGTNLGISGIEELNTVGQPGEMLIHKMRTPDRREEGMREMFEILMTENPPNLISDTTGHTNHSK